MHPVLVLTLSLLAAPPWPARPAVAAQDSKAAVKRFWQEFETSARDPRPLDERKKAFDHLEPFDDAAVAEAWVEAYAALDREAMAVESQRDERWEKLDRLFQGNQTGTSHWTTADLDQYKALQAELSGLSRTARGLRDAQEYARLWIEDRQSEGALRYYLKKVLGNDKLPLSARMTAGRALGGAGEELLPDLGKTLSRVRDTEEACALLTALGRLGAPALPHADAALKHLDHKHPAVREKAAWALARLGAPQAIEPLVERLEEEQGHTQKRVAAALEVLTGQTLGNTVRAWQRWLEEEGGPFVAGAVPLGTGTSTIFERDDEASSYYYGIPQDGRAIVYVIDVSGSMRVSLENPVFRGNVPVPSPPGKSRLDAAKQELVKALRALPAEVRFELIAFHDVPRRLSDRLQPVGPRAIAEACDWVENLEANRATNMLDALEAAFRLAGRGSKDRHYDTAVDTIFLLTDGTPTDADGSPAPTDPVLEAVNRWNPYGRVVIHCVGIGEQVHESFLEQLAHQNGGRFVKR